MDVGRHTAVDSTALTAVVGAVSSYTHDQSRVIDEPFCKLPVALQCPGASLPSPLSTCFGLYKPVTSSVSSLSIHSFSLPGRDSFLKVTSLPFRQVSSADPDDILGQEGISSYTALYGGEDTEVTGVSPRSQSWFTAGKCLTEHKGA